MSEQQQQGTTQLMSNAHWDLFVKGDLLNFMQKHNLQKITVDDGAGKKGVIRVNAAGENKVSVTSNETL